MKKHLLIFALLSIIILSNSFSLALDSIKYNNSHSNLEVYKTLEYYKNGKISNSNDYNQILINIIGKNSYKESLNLSILNISPYFIKQYFTKNYVILEPGEKILWSSNLINLIDSYDKDFILNISIGGLDINSNYYFYANNYTILSLNYVNLPQKDKYLKNNLVLYIIIITLVLIAVYLNLKWRSK